MAERLALVHDRIHVGLSCRQPAHAAELLRVGITHWIDHRSTRCEDATLQALRPMTYLWNPTKDDGRPKSVDWYATSIGGAIAALDEDGSAVLVSCARGQHRGPSIVYGVLRIRYGCDQTTAIGALTAAWPPSDPWYAADIERNLTTIEQRVSRT